MVRSLFLAACVLVAWSCGNANGGGDCDQANIRVTDPVICVDRCPISFGIDFGQGNFINPADAGVVARYNQTWIIRNNSVSAALNLEPITLTGMDPGAFTIAFSGDGGTTMPGNSIPAQVIPPRGEAFIRAEFTPVQPRFYAATMLVRSNAANRPNLDVTLTGCGVRRDTMESSCLNADAGSAMRPLVKPCD